MTTFTFTDPQGKDHIVTGPEGATQEQAFAILQSQLGSAPPDPRDRSQYNGLPRGGPGMEENARNVELGAKASFDRTALGVKGLLPQGVQDAGDWIDKQLGSGGLTKQNAFVQPASWSGLGGAVGADLAMSAVPISRGAQIVSAALRRIPLLGAIAPALGDVAANAGYAAATNPEDRRSAAEWGGGGAAVARALPLALRGFRGAPGSQAAKLQNEGIAPSVGRILNERPGTWYGEIVARGEDLLKNVPVAGHFMNQTKARALDDWRQAGRTAALPSTTYKHGADSTTDLADSFHKEYERILSNVEPEAFKLPNWSDFNTEAIAKGLPVTPDQIAKADYLFTRVLDATAHEFNGQLSPLTHQAAETRAKTLAFGYIKSSDPEQQALGDLLYKMADTFKETWRKGLPESARKPLDIVDDLYANYVPLRTAAAKNPNVAAPDEYTPKFLLNTIRRLDPAQSKSGFRAGALPQQQLAQAAEDVLGSKSLDQSSLAGIVGTTGVGLGAHALGLPALAVVGAASVYAHPLVQRYLTGMGVGQRQFVDWWDKLPAAQRTQFLTQIANVGRVAMEQEWLATLAPENQQEYLRLKAQHEAGR